MTQAKSHHSNAGTSSHRIIQLDFLRGLAVILVLLNHHWVSDFTSRWGWLGVDLFFVLSGFLVSGLLFREFQQFGSIRPLHFLIRRGFKIYPLFYLSILITFFLRYVISQSYRADLNFRGTVVEVALHGIRLLIELLFLQSFFFGYWGHHWSLSVEEHFYFSVAMFLFFMVRKKKLLNQCLFLKIGLGVFLVALILRILVGYNFSTNEVPVGTFIFTPFHMSPLSLDMLFTGVLISYLYHFDFDSLKSYYKSFRLPSVVVLAVLGVLFSWFGSDLGEYAFLRDAISLSFVAVGLGFVLLAALLEENIEFLLRKVVSPPVLYLVGRIGFYSYAIYLFHYYFAHYFVGDIRARYQNGIIGYDQVLLSFCVYVVVCVFFGILMTILVEHKFLRLRDRHYPKRII